MYADFKYIIKYIAVIIVMTILKMLWIVPVRKKRILFISYNGKQFSDSPKYIYEYMSKVHTDYEYIWAFECPDNYPDLNVKSVRYGSVDFIFKITNSEVVITNNYLPSYIPIRKNQIVLNTWHGGGALKKCGLARDEATLYDKLFFKLHRKKYTAFLSGSKMVSEKLYKESFDFNKEILEYGLPRNAVLFSDHEEYRNRVLKYCGITNKNTKIVLYAPTFRGEADAGTFISETDQIDCLKCAESFKNYYHENIEFLFRTHHAMKINADFHGMADVSEYDDMQELLCAADVLITDYSSCMYDMALMKKPVFLYVPDIEKYVDERGFYYDFYSLPFPICASNDEISNNIINFDAVKYKSDVNRYLSKIGCCESKFAVEKTCEWICKKINGSKK